MSSPILRALSLALAALAGLGTAACAREGPLRERLKERIEARRTPAPAEGADAAAGRLTAPGDYRLSLEHDGLTRRYLVHVPRSYRADRPAPLVVAFHGGGGGMEHMADDANYGLVSKSERAGFVVVFPNGVSRLPSGMLATWNAGACCGSARDRNVDDVGFVRKMLADLATRLAVDPARVYATGMSNGAMMAYRLACELPASFRAIAAVAGTDNTLACTPATRVAVLHVHARNDTHVLFGGGAGQDAFRDRSQVTDFTSVPETVARWTKRNACAVSPERVLDAAGATCDRWRPCAEGAEVQLCVTETGGHSWPGAERVRRGKESPSQAISANDAMWAFFESLPPRGP